MDNIQAAFNMKIVALDTVQCFALQSFEYRIIRRFQQTTCSYI